MIVRTSQRSRARAGVVSVLACGLYAAGVPAAGAEEQMPAQEATIRKAAEPMAMDGNIEEKAWKDATPLPIAAIHNQNGQTLEKPAGSGRITWDDDNLYIAFEVFDDDVRAAGAGRDDVDLEPPHDLVEVFLDVNHDDHHFFEFHVNPLNGFTDLFIIRPPRDTPLYQRLRHGIFFMREWNLAEYETAVRVQGAVNDPERKDTGWTVEIRLPYRSLMMPVGQKKPKAGDEWRIQLVIQNGGSEHRYVNWSPTYESWYHHTVGTWGRVRFAE